MVIVPPKGVIDRRALGQGKGLTGPRHERGEEGAREIRRIPGLQASGEPQGAIHARGIAFEGPLNRGAVREDTGQRVELDEHTGTGQVRLGFPQDETACDGQGRRQRDVSRAAELKGAVKGSDDRKEDGQRAPRCDSWQTRP